MSMRFPVNMLDLILKCFGYGQLWPLWPTCSQIQFCTVWSGPSLEEQNQIKCGKSDLIYIYTVQNWIWSGWSGQVLAKCIWSRGKLVCENHRAWFWQNATGLLPVSHFQTLLQSSTDHNVQNQLGSDLVLAHCVRFWPNGSGLEASWCARIIRPASGQCFQANPSAMFSGLLTTL